MKKVIINVLLLSLLALPCLLTLNEPNPVTDEFNPWVNVIGLLYSAWFYKRILKKVFNPK